MGNRTPLENLVIVLGKGAEVLLSDKPGIESPYQRYQEKQRIKGAKKFDNKIKRMVIVAVVGLGCLVLYNLRDYLKTQEEYANMSREAAYRRASIELNYQEFWASGSALEKIFYFGRRQALKEQISE